MYIVIETSKLSNVIKELSRLYIKNSGELNSIDNCVLIQANIFGRVSFTCHINGLARTSIVLEDIQVINPGECLVNLFLLHKKIKYIDESYVELEYIVRDNNEYVLYIRTQNINGKLTGPIFPINSFTQLDVISEPLCDLSVSAFNSWTKIIKGFCTGLETITIRINEGYLESCTFNSLSHQTMMLYNRFAVEAEHQENFVINIPALVLNTIPNLTNESEIIRFEECYNTTEDGNSSSSNEERIFRIIHGNITWFAWTNLKPTADQLAIAEYCTTQPAYSRILLDKSTLINRLEYLVHQPHHLTNKFLINLDVTTNQQNELQLELSIDGLDDTATVLIKQIEGDWFRQKYDAYKLVSALKVFSIDAVYVEQFITDTESKDLTEALSLRLSDLQEQSRVEIYIESAY